MTVGTMGLRGACATNGAAAESVRQQRYSDARGASVRPDDILTPEGRLLDNNDDILPQRDHNGTLRSL